MTNDQTNQPTPNLLLVIHQVGDRYRCLFVDQSLATVLDTTEVPDEKSLEALIEERSPEKTVALLPGTATVCRTSILPDTDDMQLQEALRLQAEARLLGGTPEHRRAVAAMEAASGESNRIGLIIAWPEESQVRIPSALLHASFVPETGAIAALFNGSRPKEPILIANRLDGSVSLALTCPQGIAFRSTRENGATAELFCKGTIRAIKETATLHKHTELYTADLVNTLTHTIEEHQGIDPLISIPQEIIDSSQRRLSNLSTDPLWWGTWGLTVGAALATLGSLSTLTTMRVEAPVYNPSAYERFAMSIAQSKTAWRLGIAAVLLLAVGPALFSGIRLALLEFLNPEIQTQYDEVVSARKEQIVYSELTNTAWPMTKLIADVLNCTPAGIEIESLRLDVGEPISIRGRVLDADGYSAAELIALMEETLLSYRVFRDIKFSYDSAGTYGDREFDISAVVMNPLRRPRYAQDDDFGTWTLAMRQAGMAPDEASVDVPEEPNGIDNEPSSMLGAANVDTTPSPTTPTFAGDPERDERPRRDRTNDSGSDASSRSENRAGGTVAARLPEPLTEEQIKVMTLAEAKIALKDVSQGLSRVGSNAEAKTRMRNEMRMLLDRMKEVNR